MNPARAQMLARASSDDARNPSPLPEVNNEEGWDLGPLRSGSNCSALGDRSRRISRSSQQPEDSRVASACRPGAGLSRLRENINSNTSSLPKRPLSDVVKHEDCDREKKPKLNMTKYYTDVQTLGRGKEPQAELKYPLTQAQLLIQTPILDILHHSFRTALCSSPYRVSPGRTQTLPSRRLMSSASPKPGWHSMRNYLSSRTLELFRCFLQNQLPLLMMGASRRPSLVSCLRIFGQVCRSTRSISTPDNSATYS